MEETTTESQHQSAATKKGKTFEKEIYKKISDLVHDPEFVVLQPGAKVYSLDTTKPKKRFSCLQLHTPIGSLIGDTDIVIFNKQKKEPVVIVSCKTSLHGRITESLYYARLYRDRYGSHLPMFFVTKDEHLEFGTEKDPHKPRILAAYENIFVYSSNPNTPLGGCIKSLDSLASDIRRVI